MAATLDKYQLHCPVCMELLTDPVSTPCGHNFCKLCIERYWNSSEVCQCPMCKETFYNRPELRINISFKEVVNHFISTNAGEVTASDVHDAKSDEEVECDVCTVSIYLSEVKALKSCLVCMASYCEIHLEPHTISMALSRHTLIKPTKHLQERMCKRHERIMELFCKKEEIFVCHYCAETKHSGHEVVTIEEEAQQIRENAQKEMEHSVQVYTTLLESINQIHTTQMEEMEARYNGEQARFEDLLEQLRWELAELEKKSIELEDLSHTGDHVVIVQTPCHFLLTPRTPTEDIYIDPDTAGPWLVVSDDGKEVRQSPKKHKVQSNPQRFTESLCVLATQGFHTGKHFWEVSVQQKANWMLGVASGTAKREEHSTLSPEKGFWTLRHSDGKQYVVFSKKPFPLELSPRPQRVGVFVDYEEGQVSFFNVAHKTHIFTYTKCNFAERVYPVFDPCLTTDKKDPAPLKIMTVEKSK
ncbi:E3 ubiquitin-protein ligase TRIM39-like [Diretmus argenteus]